MTATGAMSSRLTNKAPWKAIAKWFGYICILGILVAIGFQFYPVDHPSPEFIYTRQILLKIWLPFFITAFIIASGFFQRIFGKIKGMIAIGLLLLAAFLILVPEMSEEAFYLSWRAQAGLSACWGLAGLAIGALFFLVASGLGSIGAWINCLLGSLFLGLGIGEFWFLLTAQPADWVTEDQAGSRYLSEGARPFNRGDWAAGICGSAPRKRDIGYIFAHRQLRKEQELFDVKYSMNKDGRRALPASGAVARNELLLFGCSFTFGHGLNDEDTWAYKLARDLGPDWKVENYSQSGFGAMQTLCMLENKLVQPYTAPNRFALFLAIRHQLLRNDFFLASPHYITLSNGSVEREGTPKHEMITRLQYILNGSQLARETSSFLTNVIAKDNEQFRNDFLSMLAAISKTLEEKYGAKFMVLLWPDVAELAPDLKRRGIACLELKRFLPDWDKDGGKGYLIKPPYEMHPNQVAATLLAKGIAADLKRSLEDQGKASGAKAAGVFTSAAIAP